MKILLNGILGRMGQEIYKLCENGYEDCVITGGVDVNADESKSKNISCPIFKNIKDANIEYDCIVDFSHHSGIKELLDFAKEKKKAVVVATTGHTNEEKELIQSASKSIPIFYASNMSIGIALLCHMAKLAAKTFPNADIEIIEKHHNRKLDAPSGTALTIANEIKEIKNDSQFVLGRNGQKKREKNDIGIHAIRVGNLAGEHEVIIGTDSQIITLKHEACSPKLFAEGAITAAKFIIEKEANLYDMHDLVKF